MLTNLTVRIKLDICTLIHWPISCVYSSSQVQGLAEHFIDKCGGIIKWLDEETSYTAFSEGWALYAEDPLIGEDTDTYKNEPWPKYGMLKWQVSSSLYL